MIVAARLSRKRSQGLLIDAARQSGIGGDCRADWWATGPAFAVESGAASVAFDVHLEDGGVMDEAIDDGEGHRLVGEDLAPFTEGLVRSDEQGSPLVPSAYELEQHTGFGLILGDVGEVVEHEQVVFVELGDRGLQSQLAARNLQALDEIGRASEQDTPTVFDESEAEGCRQVALSAAGRDRGIVPDTRGRTRRSATPFILASAAESRSYGVICSVVSPCWWSNSPTGHWRWCRSG